MNRVARWIAAGVMTLAVGSQAHAGFTVTYYGPATWGGGDASVGVAGYTIEDFEDVNLAAGLLVSRLNGAAGNFGPTNILPATSVFNPTTDPASVVQAFVRGTWDGSNVLINHPGPSFAASAPNWYSDSANWQDLEFTLPANTISVGFSVQQMEQAGNQLTVNGFTVLSSDLMNALAAMGSDFEPYAFGSFRSRNGYVRIDATGGDTINTLRLDNAGGDGFVIDHLAFQVASAEVPEPASLALLGLGVAAVGAMRRRR